MLKTQSTVFLRLVLKMACRGPRWSLGPLLLHLGGRCLRANVQPSQLFIAATVLTGLWSILLGVGLFWWIGTELIAQHFWILLFILDHGYVLCHFFWSQSHYMLKLFILTRGLLQTDNSPVPRVCPWECGNFWEWVNQQWESPDQDPVLFIRPFTAHCKLLGALQTLLYGIGTGSTVQQLGW